MLFTRQDSWFLSIYNLRSTQFFSNRGIFNTRQQEFGKNECKDWGEREIEGKSTLFSRAKTSNWCEPTGHWIESESGDREGKEGQTYSKNGWIQEKYYAHTQGASICWSDKSIVPPEINFSLSHAKHPLEATIRKGPNEKTNSKSRNNLIISPFHSLFWDAS